MHGDFESGLESFNPWGGVDIDGNLRVWIGVQLAVNDSGLVGATAFSPSVAVGDLNGDGLPDLVVADARGYFWFFPNTGKPDAPAFTHPEIIPIWLSNDARSRDVVPRINLVDFDRDGKLDIVAGNYAGQLYYIHNTGTAGSPDFRMPKDPATIQVPTHKRGQLWCNYLAPFLYDWRGTGVLDLVMGDGSYSANSIFLFTNKGSNDSPTFNEEHVDKIIPGMGREHLTPQVVDWNNDGKPDIIAGERSGYINVYLNQAVDKTAPPSFDKDHPLHVMFGNTEQVGSFTTVCAADINHDGLFDLICSSTDGRILYSLNTGKLGAPQFGPLVPFKATNPYPHIFLSNSWAIDTYQPYGAAYELLECTNAAREAELNGTKGPDTSALKEPEFTLPPGFKGKGALKFSIFNTHPVSFQTRYVPNGLPPKVNTTNTRFIRYTGGGLPLQTESSYNFSFWVRSTGNISNLTWHLESWQKDADDNNYNNFYQGGVGTGSSWNRASSQVQIVSMIEKQKKVGLYFGLYFTWEGDGTLYFDDFTMNKTD